MKSFLKYGTFIFLFFLTGMVAFSQNSQIRGFVYDEANGEPVIYTNVYLKGTKIGATTDVNGYYVISKVPEGHYTLQVTSLGYDTARVAIHVGKADLISKNLYIKATKYTLEAVVVTAEQQQRITETRISTINVSPTQIERLPSVGGQSDFAQYLQVLPGVIFTGDQGGQLYIRGGSPIQNKLLMDGMTIYNPFHSIGMFSVFETDLIRNVDVYTGGFNAEYGGRVSSIMDMSLRDGNKKRHSGKVQATTFGANVMAEGPLKKMKPNQAAAVTYVLSAKGSYLEQSSKALYPYATDEASGTLPFNYLDLYGKITLSSDNGSKFSWYGFRYDDNVNNYMGTLDYNWNTYGGAFSFLVIPETVSMLMDGRIALSKYRTDMKEHAVNSPERYSDIFGLTANMNFNHYIDQHEIKWGFEINTGNTNYEFTNFAKQTSSLNDRNNEFGVYAKYKGIFGKFIIEPGFRMQWYAALQEISPEPRLSLKYNITSRFRLKASAGIYSQNLIAATSDRDVVNLFYGFLASVENLPEKFREKEIASNLQKAQHVVGGMEYDIGKYLTLNLEGYYKNFGQLTTINRNKMYSRDDTDKPEYLRNDFIIENGQAYGIDFSAKFDFDKIYFWAAYSLAYVERHDELITYNPHYDRRHNLNLLASYKWGKAADWEMSARWNYGSGFPFTPLAGSFEKLIFNTVDEDYLTQNGDIGMLYGKPYSFRLPSYHRLDLDLKKTFFLGQHTTLEASIGVTNLYNRENPFYYSLMKDEQINQLPILPNFGLCFKF